MIGLTAYWRWSGGEFRRPLQIDEVISLGNYTWAGVEPTGDRHRLRRIQDLYALRRPTPSQIVMGLYCSLGRWTEPNNHIINSLLMNTSIAWGNPDEGSVRLPALLGAVVFAALMIPAMIRYDGAWLAVPLLIACVLWHPYVLRFSGEARGYTWMLALQAGLLVVLTYLSDRPCSVGWGVICVVLSVSTFMNVVSLAIDWILPFYLTALLMPVGPEVSTNSGREPGHMVVLRRNLTVQALAVVLVGLVFLVDRLPAVVVSARLYGIPFRTPGQLVTSLGQIIHDLFPTTSWKFVAMLGLLGVMLPGRSTRRRWLRALMVMTIFTSLAHFLLAGRLPYWRACGYGLPFIFLGLANLARIALEWCETRPARAVVWLSLAMGAVIVASPSSHYRKNEALSDLFDAARRLEQPPGRTCMSLFPQGSLSESLSLYLPQGWLSDSDRLPIGTDVELEVISMDEPAPSAEAPLAPLIPEGWVRRSRQGSPRLLEAGVLRLFSIPGSTERFIGSPPRPTDGRALVFWYPDMDSVAVTSDCLREFVGRSGLRHQETYRRYQIKLDVYVVLRVVILAADSPGECEAVAKVVSSGIHRFGGEAVVFLARPQED